MSIEKSLLNKLSEIASLTTNLPKSTYLPKHSSELNNIGLLSGTTGIAMFQFYYSQFINTNEYADLGMEKLLFCIDNVKESHLHLAYSNGLVGLGWAINHLHQEDFIDIDDNLLLETDDYLFQTMQTYLNNANYDFLHGALGYGFYFLKRYRNTKSPKLKERYKKYLLEFIALLDELSITQEDLIKWESIIDINTREKGYNLGLSHGISSIVNFLSRLYAFQDFQNKVEHLLKGGVNFILFFMNEEEDSFSLFPNYIKVEGEANWNSRVAWCYGDLGIGLSLWKASKALNDDKLEKTAIKVLKRTSKRRLPKKSLVNDAGLCHGSFGNAQVFNYFYRQTGITEFKNASKFWIKDGVNKANHKSGYAGFKRHTPDGWTNELSLLEGIAGIGLSIISHLSEEEVNWDECLMIS